MHVHMQGDDKRIVTFNVCGIKNLFAFKPWNEWKTLGTSFAEMGADIVCFQETKLQQQDLTKQWAIVKGYQSFFSFSSVKKGYSGVAVYIKDNIAVSAAEEGLSGCLGDLSKNRTPYKEIGIIGGYPSVSDSVGKEIDQEGRTLVIDIGACVLIGLYCPANSQGDKEEYRALFFQILDERVRLLKEAGREVIVMGDINVTPSLQDSAHAQDEARKQGTDLDVFAQQYASMSPQREIVNSWLNIGFQDTTRDKHPDRSRIYTCWDLRVDGRGANFGSRIDLILASSGLKCSSADIMLDYYGSDHCPVYADINLATSEPGAEYTAPLLSKKRCSAFTTIQSFWAKSGRASPSPTPTPTPPPLVVSQPHKIQKRDVKLDKKSIKRPSQGQITSFFKLISSAAPSTVAPVPRLEPPGQVEIDPSVKAALAESATQTSQAWKDIFALNTPLCYHKEECKLLKSNKAGANKGRSFWSCKRPQGEENNNEFRCKFFKWA